MDKKVIMPVSIDLDIFEKLNKLTLETGPSRSHIVNDFLKHCLNDPMVNINPSLKEPLIELGKKTDRDVSYLVNDSLKHYLKIFKD